MNSNPSLLLICGTSVTLVRIPNKIIIGITIHIVLVVETMFMGVLACVAAPSVISANVAATSNTNAMPMVACALPQGLNRGSWCRTLDLFSHGRLAPGTDGRTSAGPVDVQAFLAQPKVKEVRNRTSL
jgi:hypothetical protein